MNKVRPMELGKAVVVDGQDDHRYKGWNMLEGPH